MEEFVILVISYTSMYNVFVKDIQDSGDVRLVYCPTEMILVYFFIKPLYRSISPKLRKVIIGWKGVNISKKDIGDNQTKFNQK